MTVSCVGHESVKNVFESLGIPHPEVEALLVNGTSVGFGYLVQPGDWFEVYPISATPEVNVPLVELRPRLATFHFVLDIHLGRLAAYLRMLGFDSLYRNDYEDPFLAQLAHNEQRILLTRDIELLKRSLVTYGYFVRSTRPTCQLEEVVRRFRLYESAALFQRCMRCNGLTQPVEKAAVLHLLEPKTKQFYDEFWQCQSCGQVYWRGSHYTHMQQFVESILNQQSDDTSDA